MKIVIINAHTNNYGDDIAGSAVLGELIRRFPRARIEVFYSFNLSQARMPFNHPQVTHQDQSVLWSKRLVSQLTDFQLRKTGYFKVLADSLVDANVVLVSPCGANIGIYRDWRFLACVCLCVNQGKHVIFHLNTIGNSNSKIFNFVARRALKRCHIFVRELRSHQYLKELGISNELGVDSAFLAPKLDISPGHKMRAITFIPTRISSWHPDFRNFNEDIFIANVVQDLCDGANKFQLAIRLLPHLWGEISEHEYIGSLATKIRQNLAPHLDVSILNPQTAYDYDRAIADSYLVVSMRYHGCILAIKNAVPFVALSYENKMKEACFYADAIDDYLDIKEYRSGQLAWHIHRSVNSYASTVSRLNARYPALHRMAHKPIDYLEAFLTGKTQT
jgi:polysaccharide pyruvyl transferase WcaK-like protein